MPMPLINKLALIKTSSTLSDLPTGKAKDFDEFWNKIIEPTLPDVDIVCQWHDLLLNYINNPNPVFFVREYAGPSGNGDELRRGFYNTTDYDFSTVYCDNGFTAYFYSMAFDGYVPDIDDFEAIMKSRKFPCCFIQTKEENSYAAYFRGKNPAITEKGYKIAHIFSAGEGFNGSAPYKKVGDFCGDIFPRAVNTDWNNTQTDCCGKYYYRHMPIEHSKAGKAKDFAIAHFMRMVHPINYFLVPKITNQYDKTTQIMKTNIVWRKSTTLGKAQVNVEIGEDAALINYVADKIKKRYENVGGRNIYNEFLNLIYPIPFVDPPTNQTIDADYGIDVWKNHQAELIAAGHTKKSKKSAPKTKSKKVKVATAVASSLAPAITPSASSSKHNNNKPAGTTSVQKEDVPVILIPSDPVVFKQQLLSSRRAEITWRYKDGTKRSKPWRAYKLEADSDVMDNIKTRPEYRTRKKDDLLEVVVKIL